MDLNVGDIVEFKNYEDMSWNETLAIPKNKFPKSGKVTKIVDSNGGVVYFYIKGNPCCFSNKSVARVISDVDDVDINSLKPGDEVLVKANLNEIFEDNIYVTSKINKKNVVKILKRKEPEYFIVQENYYGMYIGGAGKLVSDKSKAKIYTSGNIANSDATDMHLNAWDVIPYE